MSLRPARYTAQWVLPVTSPPIADGAVLVDEHGIIRAVGPRDHVPAPAAAEDIALGDAALLPGLVNTHAHPELTLLRGALEDLPFPDWIGTLLRIRREAGLSAEDYRAAAQWGCLEALAAGITTLAATEDSDATVHALRASGQRGVVFREVFGPSPEQCDAALATLRAQLAALEPLQTSLVRVGVSPHAPFTVSDALFRAVARLARDQDLPLAVHAAESATEDALVRHGNGVFGERLRARGMATPPRARSPIALLEATGILAASPLIIHAVRINAEDIAALSASGARVAHCPTANARLGHGIAPVTDLLDAGVTVGLGTDSMASNNRMDLLEEARQAQALQRARLQSPVLLPPAALLRMVTLEGARALGLAARVGSLEAGKDADLCAVSFRDAHVQPVHDPLAALFLAARGSDVTLTVVQGRVLWRDGRALSLDATRAQAALQAAAGKVRSHIAAHARAAP